MVRTKARENAFLLLFQSSFDGADISDILSANAEVGEIETDEFCEKLIKFSYIKSTRFLCNF